LPKGAVESHLFNEAGTDMASVSSRPRGTQWKSAKKLDEKEHDLGEPKENRRLQPKRMRVGERAVMAGRPILRDIVNDLMGS